jgi:hypothetical protein
LPSIDDGFGERAGAVDEARSAVVAGAPGRGVVAQVERAAPGAGLETEAGGELPFRDVGNLVAVARAGEEAGRIAEAAAFDVAEARMRPGQAGIGREREAAALGAGEVVTDQCSESVGGRAAAVA